MSKLFTGEKASIYDDTSKEKHSLTRKLVGYWNWRCKRQGYLLRYLTQNVYIDTPEQSRKCTQKSEHVIDNDHAT